MKPVLQALILAERVYEDVSHKKIIVGTFSTILIAPIRDVIEEQADETKFRLIPGGTDPGCPSVYVSLTDVVDGTEIVIQVANLTKNLVLFQSPTMRLTPNSRISSVEIIAPLPPLSPFITEAGNYSLDVIWKGEILGSYRIFVQETPKSN
jgi:hypothetical protein